MSRENVERRRRLTCVSPECSLQVEVWLTMQSEPPSLAKNGFRIDENFQQLFLSSGCSVSLGNSWL